MEGNHEDHLGYSILQTMNIIWSEKKKQLRRKAPRLETYMEVVNGNRCQNYKNEGKRGNYKEILLVSEF